MVLNREKTYKNLKNKGFFDSESHSKDHKWLEYRIDGKTMLFTKLSHSGKDIGEHLIMQMSKQCKLSKKDFADLANCPLSAEKYRQIIENKEELR